VPVLQDRGRQVDHTVDHIAGGAGVTVRARLRGPLQETRPVQLRFGIVQQRQPALADGLALDANRTRPEVECAIGRRWPTRTTRPISPGASTRATTTISSREVTLGWQGCWIWSARWCITGSAASIIPFSGGGSMPSMNSRWVSA
jgi:hypothetical protein